MTPPSETLLEASLLCPPRSGCTRGPQDDSCPLRITHNALCEWTVTLVCLHQPAQPPPPSLVDASEVAEIPGHSGADPGGAHVACGGRDVAGRVRCERGAESGAHLGLILL